MSTVAVLGSGVDRIYPSRHGALVRQILDEDRGAVVSEFPMGTPPDAPNFPRRNRLIAGMTRGTLVVEARETGGPLNTACRALEQTREVWAVPAPLFSEMVGTNRLIRRGYAALVTEVPGAEAVAAAAGRPPGTLVRRPDLAATLAGIGDHGRGAFYDGGFGRALLALGDGLYEPPDLAEPASGEPQLGLQPDQKQHDDGRQLQQMGQAALGLLTQRFKQGYLCGRICEALESALKLPAASLSPASDPQRSEHEPSEAITAAR